MVVVVPNNMGEFGDKVIDAFPGLRWGVQLVQAGRKSGLQNGIADIICDEAWVPVGGLWWRCGTATRFGIAGAFRLRLRRRPIEERTVRICIKTTWSRGFFVADT